MSRLGVSWLIAASLLSFAAHSQIAGKLDDVVTPAGAGAQYTMKIGGATTEVALYFAKAPGTNQKAIEIFFRSPGQLLPIELWQQFHLGQSGSGQIKVNDGYVYAEKFKARKLDPEYLRGFDGVQVSQFLMTSKDQLKRHFVASEKVKVPAGEVTADHYRIERAGQTVDFWIHHDSKPIGLVRLKSSGQKMKHNYDMQMTQLVTGVKQKIEPSEAKPMNDEARAFLPKPSSSGSGGGMGMF